MVVMPARKGSPVRSQYRPPQGVPVLRTVPRLAGKTGLDHRFDVSGQVMAAGSQAIHVKAVDDVLVRTTENQPSWP